MLARESTTTIEEYVNQLMYQHLRCMRSIPETPEALLLLLLYIYR